MNRNNNILINKFTNAPFGAYPFDKVEISHYREAFLYGLEKKKAEIEAIKNNTEVPSFENTILALEKAGEDLNYVSGIFFNLLHCNSSSDIQEIAEEIIPLMSQLSTEIILDEVLFRRVESVYNKKDELNLDQESQRLLKNSYDGFKDSGATLSEDKKKILQELSDRLSLTSLKFSNNILKEQNEFKYHITDSEIVEGLPESLLRLSKEAAIREGHKEGWLFDLSAPSMGPFLSHCKDRKSREYVYKAKATLCANDNQYNNKSNVIELVNGRLQEANLLGYEDFATMTLEHRMAKNTKNVYDLLHKLVEGYKSVADNEVRLISDFAAQSGETLPLEPWDFGYWSERYREYHYEIKSEDLRPYLPLDNVINAVFGLATKLYGISFKYRNDIPVYHKDVRVFEVLDNDNSHLGLLYTDFFPRPGKQNGAWMNNLKDQYIDDKGIDHRPHIILVMNFTPPTADCPALLTLGEVSTFLHEFGHALHGLFSKCRYESMSGTSVARDFVELPSQLMENWLLQSEWLKSFAKHYITGEEIPQDYIDKLERARHFMTGYATCRQVSFGLLDMAWHTIKEPLNENLNFSKFEDVAWQSVKVLPSVYKDAIMSTSFSHIFNGGYSAGYYGYKWAEVLDADAFEYFISGGLYNTEVAERFRRIILQNGDKKDADELYLEFRGKAPTVDALMRRDGITSIRN